MTRLDSEQEEFLKVKILKYHWNRGKKPGLFQELKEEIRAGLPQATNKQISLIIKRLLLGTGYKKHINGELHPKITFYPREVINGIVVPETLRDNYEEISDSEFGAVCNVLFISIFWGVILSISLVLYGVLIYFGILGLVALQGYFKLLAVVFTIPLFLGGIFIMAFVDELDFQASNPEDIDLWANRNKKTLKIVLFLLVFLPILGILSLYLLPHGINLYGYLFR
jgi:hypothetical protein